MRELAKIHNRDLLSNQRAELSRITHHRQFALHANLQIRAIITPLSPEPTHVAKAAKLAGNLNTFKVSG